MPTYFIVNFKLLLKGKRSSRSDFLSIAESLLHSCVHANFETICSLSLDTIIVAKSSERVEASITAETRRDGRDVEKEALQGNRRQDSGTNPEDVITQNENAALKPLQLHGRNDTSLN